jgi:hypothetical protein
VKRVNKAFYIISIFGAWLLGAGLGTWLQFEHLRAAGAVPVDWRLMLLPFALGTYASVVSLVLLYKMWRAIQGGVARATPGEAVGFLFIPFYNIYWIFQAFWGWTKDFNRFTRTHGIRAPHMPEEIALAACVFPLIVLPFQVVLEVAGLQYVAAFTRLPIGLFSEALMAIVCWRACDGLNAVARAYAQALPAGMAQETGKPESAAAPLWLPPHATRQPYSTLAIGSIIAGILGLPTFGIGSICGLVFGTIAYVRIRKSRGLIRGKDAAKAGILISAGSLLLAVPFAIIWFKSIPPSP